MSKSEDTRRCHNRSTRFALVLSGFFFLLAAAGCTSLDESVVDSLADGWGLIEAYAVRGIETDDTLDRASKALRLGTVREFSALIEELHDVGRGD